MKLLSCDNQIKPLIDVNTGLEFIKLQIPGECEEDLNESVIVDGPSKAIVSQSHIDHLNH